jgi:membrane-associated phospholipid phosphatase
MDGLYEFSFELIRTLQSVGWLEAPMRFFSFLGTQEFFIFVLPAVYWCIDAALGVRIGFILLLSNAFNESAKLALHEPRPYWISTQIKALTADASFGAPSGHAQIAAGVWGVLAAGVRRRWAAAAAVILIFLIGLSRIYLGVHFLHDALLGWLLGGITLWIFLAAWEPAARWLSKRTLWQKLASGFLASALLLIAGGGLVSARRDHGVPEIWTANAARAGEPLPAPVSMSPIVTAAGTLLGFSIGLALLQQRGGFKPAGRAWQRLLCFVVGLVGLLAVYLGLKAVFPADDALLGSGLRFLRYALLGLWVSAGAPWAFGRLGLLRT